MSFILLTIRRSASIKCTILIGRSARNLSTTVNKNAFNHLFRSGKQCVNYELSHQLSGLNTVRNYCDKKKAEQLKPEDKLNQIKEELARLESQIKELKGKQSAAGDLKQIKIEDGKYDKQSEDDEIIYKMAYDFPGFKSKNIKVTVSERILKIYAFQTSSKKGDAKEKNDAKEYIYENTTEEILPNEIDLNQIKAKFDSENGLLIVEAILPEDSNLDEIKKRTCELNDKLFKLEKELEAKKKELANFKI